MEKEEIKKILLDDFNKMNVGPAIYEKIKLGPGLDWCANYILNVMNNDRLSFSASRAHLESVLAEMGFGLK
jgi:hypothetical protein